MKLINSSFEILEQKPGIEGIYEAIELAGRTCYKSERPEGKTAKDFVDMLIKRGHLSPLEHGTVYLNLPPSAILEGIHVRYINNPYSKFIQNGLGAYITTNMRVLHENDWLDDLQYLCEPTEHHEKRTAVKFICDRGVSHELVRHRVFSFCQESTRYCNYSGDRFSNELTFIIPSWIDIPEGQAYWHDGICWRVGATKENNFIGISINPTNYSNAVEITNFLEALEGTSRIYISLLKQFNKTPQQARQVLPNALKTEVVMTGFNQDWKGFFNLRTDNAAHIDIRKLAIPLKEEFIKRGYIE